MDTVPSIGLSQFARDRHTPTSGRTYYVGCTLGPDKAGVQFQSFTPDEAGLIRLVQRYWDGRKPGYGRTDLDKVVVVPVPAGFFRGTTCLVDENMVLQARLDRRQEGEEPFIRVQAVGLVATEPCHHAYVVCYSKEALLENDGKRSTDCDWEIVCMVASPVENEPPHPLTMARNFLEKPGGTYCHYTAQQFAEAIWYWARRCSIMQEQR